MGNFNSKPAQPPQSDTSNPSDPSDPSNPLSKEFPSMPISDMVDYIASYYILTMDFASLNKLLNKKYCDKMIILTADIISAHVTSADIDFLEKKVVDGTPIDQIVKKNVTFLNRDDIDKLDIPDPVSKQRACVGIAKYYIKIAHVFASIVMTLNPIYSYKDALGNTVKVPYYKKSSIPKDAKPQLSELGLCAEKIHSLQGDQNYSKPTDGSIKVHPKICAININMDGSVKTLVDEPGIPDLMHLFYDDNYDIETGKFTGMSTETAQMYQDSVNAFYKTFTGNNDVPADVTEFKHIKLKDYRGSSACSRVDHTFISSPGDSTTRRKLFVKYASHVRDMMNKANKNQEKLISIVNRLFEHILDPVTKKTTIRVSSLLNDEMLQPIVEETRKLIIELYLTCEMDYVEGVKIYEAIVQSVIIDVTQKQIDALEKKKDDLVKSEQANSDPKKDKKVNDDKTRGPDIPVGIPYGPSIMQNMIDTKKKEAPRSGTNAALATGATVALAAAATAAAINTVNDATVAATTGALAATTGALATTVNDATVKDGAVNDGLNDGVTNGVINATTTGDATTGDAVTVKDGATTTGATGDATTGDAVTVKDGATTTGATGDAVTVKDDVDAVASGATVASGAIVDDTIVDDTIVDDPHYEDDGAKKKLVYDEPIIENVGFSEMEEDAQQEGAQEEGAAQAQLAEPSDEKALQIVKPK